MPRTPATAAAAKKAAAAAKLPPPKKTAAARPPAAAPVVGSAGVVEVPLALIDDSTRNPRETLPGLPGLAKSIEARGLLQLPKVIATGDGRYRIVDGHRRCAAAKLAGLTHIRVDVEPADGPTEPISEMVDRMVANLERADLTVMDEARGYAELKAGGMQQNQIAEAVNRNPGHVSKRLKLLALPESLQALVDLGVDAGGISIEQGVAIAGLPGKVQVAIAERLAKRKHSSYEIDNVVREEVRAHERAGEVVQVVKKLRAAGANVLNVDGDTLSAPPRFDLDAGPALVYALDADEAAHAKLSCHAVVVRQSPNLAHSELLGRWTDAVCTDPASHRPAVDAAGRETAPAVPVKAAPAQRAPSSPRMTKAEREVEAARQQLREEIAAAKAARGAFVVDVCHGKVAAIMRDYVLRGQIRDVLFDREYFCSPRDLDPIVANAEAGDVTGLAELCTAGGADRLVRAALAARLTTDLETVDRAVDRGARGEEAQYLSERDVLDVVVFYDFATTCGYEPSPIEVRALEHLWSLFPDPLRAALLEKELLDEVDPRVDPAWHDRLRAQGVTDKALSAAVGAGVPYNVWLEPGRDTPFGRCPVCHGPARALGVGNAGRHAPGGGQASKGGEACPGGLLMSIDEVAELSPVGTPAADGVDAVTCETCQGVGRVGDQTELCGDCGGRGMVAPASSLAEVATG